MTWTKTGAEFPGQCANDGLSDGGYRTHHELITWLYNMEDMSLRIPRRLIRNITYSEDWQDCIAELICLGYWREHEPGHEIELLHHASIVRQSIGAQLTGRQAAKARMRKHRNKREVTRNATPNVTRDVTENVTGAVTANAVRDLSAAKDAKAQVNGVKPRRQGDELTEPRTDPREDTQ